MKKERKPDPHHTALADIRLPKHSSSSSFKQTPSSDSGHPVTKTPTTSIPMPPMTGAPLSGLASTNPEFSTFNPYMASHMFSSSFMSQEGSKSIQTLMGGGPQGKQAPVPENYPPQPNSAAPVTVPGGQYPPQASQYPSQYPPTSNYAPPANAPYSQPPPTGASYSVPPHGTYPSAPNAPAQPQSYNVPMTTPQSYPPGTYPPNYQPQAYQYNSQPQQPPPQTGNYPQNMNYNPPPQPPAPQQYQQQPVLNPRIDPNVGGTCSSQNAKPTGPGSYSESLKLWRTHSEDIGEEVEQ